MVSYVSPGVYTIEKDVSQFAPTLNSSVVGLVGFASKGPTNKATLITSPAQLIAVFGRPNEGIAGQALEGALEILEATDSLYFVRAVTTAGSLNASAEIPVGSCPAIAVSSTYFGGVSGNSGFGVSGPPVYLKVQVWDNNGTAQFASERSYTIASSLAVGLTQAEKDASGELFAWKSALGGDLDSDEVGSYFVDGQPRAPHIVAPFAGSGAYMKCTLYRDSSYTLGVPALKPIDPSYNTSGGAYGVSAGVIPLDDKYTYGTSGWTSSVIAYGTSYYTTAEAAAHTYMTDLKGGGALFQSLYPGEGYNLGLTTAGDTSGNSIEVVPLGSPFTNVIINEDGFLDESYKVGFVASGGQDIDTQFSQAATETNLLSDVVIENMVSGTTATFFTPGKLLNFAQNIGDIGFDLSGQFGGYTSGVESAVTGLTVCGAGEIDATTNSRFIKLIQGTRGLAGGTNGDSTVASAQDDALIGEALANGTKTGMQALNDDFLNISIACTPGITNQNTQNALVTLAESTQNFVAALSPPYAIGGAQDAINWNNGQSPYRTTLLNSSWAAAWWPWVKVFSSWDNKDVWLDPAIYGVRQMVYTDATAEAWFAPAGYARGRLTKPSDVEIILNQADRDSLYSGGNTINPIVKFPQQGLTIWGQKTTQKNPSALDRINVRRLMIFIRKLVLNATRQFAFEPNDPFTWDAITGVISPALLDIKSRRGLTDFAVVCDETTNTPARVDRNELWCKILIKPTKTAEILVFELNLTSQNATIL